MKKFFKSKCERCGHDWKENWSDEEERWGSRYEEPLTSTCVRCGSKKITASLERREELKIEVPNISANPTEDLIIKLEIKVVFYNWKVYPASMQPDKGEGSTDSHSMVRYVMDEDDASDVKESFQHLKDMGIIEDFTIVASRMLELD